MRRAFQRLTLAHWGWIHFKFAFGILWPAMYLLHAPRLAHSQLGGFGLIVCAMVIIGAVFSIVGLFLSAQPGARGVVGLTIELIGLMWMGAGALCYFLTQVALFFGPSGIDRLSSMAFAYAIVAAILARMLVVGPVWWAVGHRFRKSASVVA